MNENENKELLFDGNEEQTEADFEPENKKLPAREVFAPAASEEASEAAESEEISDAEEATEIQPEQDQQEAEAEAEPFEQVKEDEFNPYAPKQDAVSNDEGINPSYANKVNNEPSDIFASYPTNYGYNNQGYNQTYNTPTEKSGSGKKLVVSIVIICVLVAAIAILSSFFGEDNAPEISSTTAPHSAVPTETTAPTTVPAAPDTTVAQQQESTDEYTTTELQTTAPTTAQSVTQQQINSIWVAEKVRPSVVGVLAYQDGELAGEGSGVLMSEDEGKSCTYVVTCAHVINEPGCEFSILLLDGESYEATVVALDERTDIGVLRVEATGLPLAEFGDSASLKVGEPIYAIGNPGGSEYFGSITNGIVASIDRSISATYTMTCIQHNAAINPGNSGGALVNTAGQVIGINSSKIAKTDYEGMGFAVPSSIFASVVDSLIKYGYVPNRPELGIKYASVSDYQLYSIIVSIKGLPKGSIVIADIPEGSALADSGAQVGDLIIAVNGKKMDTSDVLLDLIDTGAVGDTLTLTLCRVNDRNYETSTFDVTVTLVEDKGSATTTTQQQTLPEQDNYGDFDSFFDDFFGW